MLWLLSSCSKGQTSAKTIAIKYDFVVAKDGSGDFKTVQEAINAVPEVRKNRTVIYIKTGVYKEKLNLPATKTNVTFIGQSVDSVVLTYDDYASKKNIFGEEMGTSASASFFIHGDGFTAENITFENSAGPVGQAVAVRVASDKVKFVNCKFLGFQDTLYTWGYGASSRQYYKNCYIEGTVDFIFGSSTAVFDDCRIFGKRGGFLTAASTPDSSKYGYVFLNCKIDGDAPPESFYLGRPWRPYAKTVFINCLMSGIIKPEGWDNWRNPENEKTVFYAEYKSGGKGGDSSKRVNWSHQLTENESKEYSLNKILNGWDAVD
ncbi:MAG: pectin esterase [Sphingobacteriales bacterium]|nr:pectin esterase [Sphingobacteriales bacterium]